MTGNKVFLKECYILGTNQYDALEEGIWEKLKISTVLKIRYKEDSEGKEDKSDKNIYLTFETKDKEGKPIYRTIGVLSEEDSREMIKYLDAKLSGIYKAIISYRDEKADEDKRFKVAIYILSK